MLHEQKKVDPSLQSPKASNLKNAQSVKIDSCSRASVVFRGRLNTVTYHVDAAPSVRHQADLQTKAAPVLAKLRMLAAAPMATNELCESNKSPSKRKESKTFDRLVRQR
jgi:hypothetical protein